MHKVIRRKLPSGFEYVPLQIWTPPDHPAGAAAAQVVVAWTSPQWGHPTSYAVLGGNLVAGPSHLDVPEDGGVFRTSRFGRDSEYLGLPSEYRDAVLAELPSGIKVTVAAHHLEGSSQIAFGIAARLLGYFLTDSIPSDDAILTLEQATRDIYGR